MQQALLVSWAVSILSLPARPAHLTLRRGLFNTRYFAGGSFLLGVVFVFELATMAQPLSFKFMI